MKKVNFKISLCIVFAVVLFGCGNSQQSYEWVVEPTFEYANGFSEGLSAVLVNNKWGFIDKAGKVAIPFTYDYAEKFSEGLAAVKKGNKWGFIDKTGEFIIEPKFTRNDGSLSYVFGNRWFVDNINLDDEKGYLDYKGNFTKEIPRLYDDTIQFSNTSPQFRMVNGKLEVQAAPDNIYPPFSEGLAKAVSKGNWGFVDKTGVWVIQPKYESVGLFSEGLANVKKRYGDWNFIDKKGNIVLTSYSFLSPLSEGLAVAAKIGKYGNFGYIDETGNWIIQPQFEAAYSFADGIAPVKKKGKWGTIKLKN